ncbi:MAG: hypothetical protein HXN77_11090 [Prevotella pallens]|nr:hypothetical protein [Prevotella pallens]
MFNKMLQSVCWSGYVRLRVNNSSAHSVGVGADSLHPSAPNNYKLLCARPQTYTG